MSHVADPGFSANRSAVPHFKFSVNPKEQEAELRDNPLMKRFAESRRRLAFDPHRPIYHFVSPESTMNDPNGLCYWNGRWHLFYQAYPPEDRRQHWGHAVSDDLVHWKDLPYAIYPGPEEKCYSGSTLVEEDRVIAMYHGTMAGNMVAVSSDPLLLNWEKITDGPVIPLLNPDGSTPPYRVFDPCIWRKGDAYYSLSGGTLPFHKTGNVVAADFLFRSHDLIHWEYLHPFVEEDRFTMVGDDGACPYFWPIGDRHMLLFFSHISGGQYLLGDYDTERDKFIATSHGRFGFGAATPCGVHAPSATPDGKGGLIVISNMNAGIPGQTWDQIMTLARRLTLGEGEQVLMEPAGDVASLRYDHRRVENVALPANEEVVLPEIQGNAMELDLKIEPSSAPAIELKVLRSPNDEEFTRIVFYRERGLRVRTIDRRLSVVSLDTTRASILPEANSRPPENAPVLIDPDEPLRLRIFIDKSVVEVFINGKQCVAARVYPGREESVGVSLRSQGKGSVARFVDAWQMKSIYDTD